MAFKSIIKFLVDPFTILWMLLLLLCAAIFLKKDRLAKWLVLVAVIWLGVVSLPLVPTLLVDSLESRYNPVNVATLENKEADYHIIILGGGHGFDSRLPANSLLSSNALGRLNEGIRLYRQLPNSKLIFSGYSASGRTTQAEMLQRAALLLGVNKAETILQREPANTYEEAKIYSERYKNSNPVILVTSAAHMPRAMQLFRAFGVNAIASPTNFRLLGSFRNKWFGLPSLDHMHNFDAAMIEYAGMAWYKMRLR